MSFLKLFKRQETEKNQHILTKLVNLWKRVKENYSGWDSNYKKLKNLLENKMGIEANITKLTQEINDDSINTLFNAYMNFPKNEQEIKKIIDEIINQYYRDNPGGVSKSKDINNSKDSLLHLCKLFNEIENIIIKKLETDDFTIKLIVKKLKDPKKEVRSKASSLLSFLDQKSLKLEDEDNIDYLIAGDKLDELTNLIRESHHLNDLIKIIDHRMKLEGHSDIRKILIKRVSDIGDETAFEYIKQMVTDDDPNIRAQAYECISAFDDVKAIEILQEGLNDSDMKVHVSAINSLANAKQITKPLVDRLVFALGDGEPEVREAAARTLASYGNIGVAIIIEVLRSSKNSYVREYAAKTLGLIGDKSAQETLIFSLDDSEREVRRGAAKALSLINALPVDEIVRMKYFIGLENKKELMKIGKPAVKFLIPLLKDKSADIRIFALDILEAIGDKDCLGQVINLLTDADKAVRKKTAIVLRRIGNPSVIDTLEVLSSKEGFFEVKDEMIRTLQKLKGQKKIMINYSQNKRN